MRREIVKIGTGEVGEAILLSEVTLGEVLRWTGGVRVEEIDPDDPSIRFVAVNYDTPMGRKRVSEGEWLVYFQGEFFAATTSSFNNRFTVRIR